MKVYLKSKKMPCFDKLRSLMRIAHQLISYQKYFFSQIWQPPGILSPYVMSKKVYTNFIVFFNNNIHVSISFICDG